MGHKKKKWAELTAGKKVLAVLLTAGQLSLTGYGYWDLAHRDEKDVNGTKLAWGIAMLVNWIGPIAYLTKGRKTS